MLVDESKTIFDTQIKEDLNYVWAIIYKDNISLMLQSIESLKEELTTLNREIDRSAEEKLSFTWDKIIIGRQDLIFPFKNQMNAWAGHNFELREMPHYDASFFTLCIQGEDSLWTRH